MIKIFLYNWFIFANYLIGATHNVWPEPNILVLNYNSNSNHSVYSSENRNENRNENIQGEKNNELGVGSFLDSLIFNKKSIFLLILICYLYTKNIFDYKIFFLCGKNIFFFMWYLLKKIYYIFKFKELNQKKEDKNNVSK